MRKPAQIFFLTLILLFFAPVKFSLAEITSNMPETAISLAIDDTDVAAGKIVSVEASGKYTLSHKEYDPNLVGVVVDNAAVSLVDLGRPQDFLVASHGQVLVSVTAEAGAIKVGDFITTSATAGYGMKAIKSGMIIGQALNAFGSDSNSSAKGSILVDVNPKFYPGALAGSQNAEFFTMLGSSILALFSKNQLAFLEQSGKLIKAIIAAVIALISIILSFLNFGRAARTGIEASGRNPLAGKLITASITLNIALTIVAGIFGVALAYLIFVI